MCPVFVCCDYIYSHFSKCSKTSIKLLISPRLLRLLPPNSRQRCLPSYLFSLVNLVMVHEELTISSWNNRQKMIIFSIQKCPILRVVLINLLLFCPPTSNKLFFWPNRLKISFFNGVQQQSSGVSSWCGNERVKNLICAWLFPSKKYLIYHHLAGHDITSSLLADLQYHLAHISIFIKYVDHATLIHSSIARLIWCNKSSIPVNVSCT